MKYFYTILSALLLSTLAYTGDTPVDPDADYDRLDGKGKSRVKVDVIEWEGNLEVHVYPKEALKSLSMKLDKTNKNNPVMVIGYRLKNNPGSQLVRRNVLSIDLTEGFKAYKDPSTKDYDKFIITNLGLSNQVIAYQLEVPPKESYPEGHPLNSETPKEDRKVASSPKVLIPFTQAQTDEKPVYTPVVDESSLWNGFSKKPIITADDEGAIKSFSW